MQRLKDKPELRNDYRSISELAEFLPEEIYDIHASLADADNLPWETQLLQNPTVVLGCVEHRAALQRQVSATTIYGLYGGIAGRPTGMDTINEWVADEVKANGKLLDRALLLANTNENRALITDRLMSGSFCGIKLIEGRNLQPAARGRVGGEAFANEWIWELLHQMEGVLFLGNIVDFDMTESRQRTLLKRLCRTYNKVRLIYSLPGAGLNSYNKLGYLQDLAELDNFYLNTSFIGDAGAFVAALQAFGPRRLLWGSNFPLSEPCRKTNMANVHLVAAFGRKPASPDELMASPLINSLLALQEGCKECGLVRADIEDIFLRNTLRTLRPHLPIPVVPAPPPRGLELWQRARSVIAGGTGLLSKRAEMFDAKTWPAYYRRCSGCEVWDLEDRRYIDFAGGIGAILLGYADVDVNAAVQRRLLLGNYCTLANPQEVQLAETLLSLHPWASKVMYARGGGEAMAMSVRIARAATGRSGVAFCGYHGWHDWYLAANLGESDALNGHLIPGLEPAGVPRELKGTAVPFRYNDIESLDVALQQLKGNLAAIVMEPMRSQWPKSDFIANVAARCRAMGGIFVVDEVTSGLRYGFPGALARFGIEPDISVYAKAMSNGFPFAAVLGRKKVMEAANSSFISSSYWTDGIGSSAALAVLEKVRRLNVQEYVWNLGEKLQNLLRPVAARHPLCRWVVGGMPATPTLSFDLGTDAPLAQTLLVRKMLQKGFLVSTIYYIMLAHDEVKIALLVEALDESLAEISDTIEAGKLAEESGVARGLRGFARLA